MNSRIKKANEVNDFYLPSAGKIKVGHKVNGLPRSVDYFIADGPYAKLFHEKYGEKPKLIQVMFASDDPDKVCRERLEYRNNQGNLIAYGDGENFKVWSKDKYLNFTTAEHPEIKESIEKKYPSKKGWEIVLTMYFWIPLQRGVTWKFTSKGNESTIPEIIQTFDTVINQAGSVKGQLFDLIVEFAKSQKPGSSHKFPIVKLIPVQSTENEILKLSE